VRNTSVSRQSFSLNRKTESENFAFSLLRRIVDEYPDACSEVNFAHEKMGSLYERMGRFAEAEREYRWVVDSYSKTRSGTSGVCDLTLAELIIRTEQSSKYVEAAELLMQAAQSTTMTFKSDWFRYWLASARLAKRIGRNSDAAQFAEKALAFAASKEPQFRRPPTVGKVVMDMSIKNELEQLSTSKSL
jgi:tetratricopeptide (TPR) repeat protein